ncbi:MAG TPA: dihydropteroate synthase [Candidatus Acidoferrales bacterium]|nr:dihydropteroate synthase [Candidatus Acidoferrales bacterium]
MRKLRWRLRSRTLVFGERTLIAGVLNVTPDSFSDGGKFASADDAIRRALEIEREGADILDIGGESTRPGAAPVSTEEEVARVIPVIEALNKRARIPISIDTRRADVAEKAIAAGAEIVNDIFALQFDPRMAEVVRKTRAGLVLMHMRGEPETMQIGPFARNTVTDVTAGMGQAMRRARRAGIGEEKVVLDPGIGFGKNFAQNFELIAHLHQFTKFGRPLMIGVSRKAFIGAAIRSAKNPAPPEERKWGTAAAVTASILHGAHIVRVHDVAEMAQVARVADRIRASL